MVMAAPAPHAPFGPTLKQKDSYENVTALRMLFCGFLHFFFFPG